MKIISTIAEFREVRSQLTGTLGFVPTMGYLHEGHLSLVRAARKDNDAVAVSIFVNSTQFAPGEDFGTYPRDIDRDKSMLEQEKVDLVFMPSSQEIYPPDFNTWVAVDKVTERLEGASRPGHFKGVATVVAKLFNIVQPRVAYFGQKDAQQAVVIQKMVADLNMNLSVIVVPTMREPDGLAMSSRNTYLNSQERQSALVLWNSLELAQRLWSEGAYDANLIHQEMRALIQADPLADIDYISIADPYSLEELITLETFALVSLSVRIGKTRLIDNIILHR